MENPQTVDELIEALSLKVFLKIHNTFYFFFANPGTRRWIVEIDHVTHRGECEKIFRGNSLIELLRTAYLVIEEFERVKAEAKDESFRTNHT